MGLDYEYIEGQTPLDEDEKLDLKISSITTQGELDEFEQGNIEDALKWLKKTKIGRKEILSQDFIRELHKRMFGEVWKWAGKFRKTNKNIGIDKEKVWTAVRQLCDDTKYWIANAIFTPEEIAIRFKHKIVSIHCFSNGNGRHSRLMADLIMEKIFGLKPFLWGATNLSESGEVRSEYISALKQADKGSFESLISFAKS